MIKNIKKNLPIILLLCVLAFKCTFMISDAYEPIEIGELQINSQYSEVCSFNEKDLLEMDRFNFNSLITIKGDHCHKFWSIRSMRGFYIHHYLSIFKTFDNYNNSFREFIGLLNHQYGLISLLLPFSLFISKININIHLYGIISLILGTLANFFLIYRSNRRKIINNQETFVITTILSVSLLTLNVYQFFLSPGFGSLRVFPITALYLFLVGLQRKRIKFEGIINYVSLIILFLILSPQFEFLIFIALLASISINRIFISLSNKVQKSIFKEKYLELKKILILCGCSIFIKLFPIILMNEQNQLFSASTSESLVHKKIFLGFSIIYGFLWTINGINSSTTKSNSNNIENKLNISSPILWISLSLFLYPAKFWGSPNHFSLYLFANAVSFGILILNILKLNLSNQFEVNLTLLNYLEDQDAKFKYFFSKNLRRIIYKIIMVNDEKIVLKDHSPKIIRFFLFLLSYLVLLVSTIKISIISKRIITEEINFTGFWAEKKINNQIINLKNDCNPYELEMSGVILKSCSLSNYDFDNHKVIISKINERVGRNNKFYYLSDNADILNKNYSKNLIPAGSYSLLKGKIEIISNSKIKEAFENSFIQTKEYYNKIEELDVSAKYNLFIDDIIYNLMNDLFSDDDIPADLKSNTVIIDNQLFEETKQLYAYAYGLWLKTSEVNFEYNSLNEISSKIHKYLWRIYIINNRRNPEYTNLRQIRLIDIKNFN